MTRITFIKRDNVELEMTFTDSNGVAIDLTNATVFFTVKKKWEDSDNDALIAVEVTSFDDPTSGIATVLLTPSETNIKAGLYYFDVQLKYPSGAIYSMDKGSVLVKQDITVRVS